MTVPLSHGAEEWLSLDSSMGYLTDSWWHEERQGRLGKNATRPDDWLAQDAATFIADAVFSASGGALASRWIARTLTDR